MGGRGPWSELRDEMIEWVTCLRDKEDSGGGVGVGVAGQEKEF
jgi:hypothetical protein